MIQTRLNLPPPPELPPVHGEMLITPHTRFRIHKHICPRISRGFLIGAPDQDSSHRLPRISATGTRVPICGVLCPGGLPYPCPGQYAHQQVLIAREGCVVGFIWVTAFLPGRDGATPVELAGRTIIEIEDYQWKSHCRGLFELPIAA